jgi:hypothetical protein
VRRRLHVADGGDLGLAPGGRRADLRPYEAALGTTSALHDQRLAGLIMLAATVPALAAALAAPLATGADSRLGSNVRVRPEEVKAV